MMEPQPGAYGIPQARPHHDPAMLPGPEPVPNSIALNPVVIAWAGNILVALLTAFGLHLTRTQAGAADTIAAAIVGAVTAATARPWYIPGITAAASSALTAGAAFGLMWTPDQIGLAVTALSLVLMLATHEAVIPAAAQKFGLTAREIQLGKALHAQATEPWPGPTRPAAPGMPPAPPGNVPG